MNLAVAIDTLMKNKGSITPASHHNMPSPESVVLHVIYASKREDFVIAAIGKTVVVGTK